MIVDPTGPAAEKIPPLTTAPNHRKWCALALAAIVIAMAMRPGDASFIADEPALLALAHAMNHMRSAQYGLHLPFTLSPVSLMGSHGLYYGPVAVWIYQLIILITDNPLIVTSIHAAMFSIVTAAALLWLARSMRVSPTLAVVTMLSPWLWFYFRQLWDNSLCIPLSAVVIAAYADFLVTHRPWSLRLTVFAAALMPLVHFMSLALILPLAIHLAFYQTRWLIRFRWSVLAIIAVVNAFGWPYWVYLYSWYQSISPQVFMPDSAWKGWFFPLLGAHNLSAAGLDSILGNDWLYSLALPLPLLLVVAETISLLIYVAVWTGMIIAITRSVAVVRRKPATPVDHLATVALMTCICQSLLDGIQRVYGQPHYFNATWIVYVIFAWLAIDAMHQRFFQRSVLARLALPVYAASLLIVLSAAGFKIARDAGTRSLHYGTDLSEQMAAAAQMKRFAEHSPVFYAFPQWQSFTDTPDSLRRWLPPPSQPAPLRNLIVRYRDAYPNDARIVVEDRPL